MGVPGFLLRNFEECVAGIFMTLMSVATFSNVIARYFFNSPIEWAEEFSRYAFIWVVFMGAAICTKRKRHIIIDGFVNAMPQQLRSLLFVLVDLGVLALAFVMIYYGWVLSASANQPTATLKIPQYVVYIVVPLSAVLIAIYSLRDLRNDVASLMKGGSR